MLRIVDGMVYEGKLAPDRWVVTMHDLGEGHREACVQRAMDWQECGPLDPDSIAAQVLRGERDDPNAGEKAEANRKRAARRAKTRARRLCKVQGLDTLLTLTYKGVQGDLALCKLHFQALCRRLRHALGEFAYVAAFERQRRGAWHVHIATRRLPASMQRKGVKVKSWNVIRAMWRDVAGEFGGNIDVARRRSVFRSPAKCAAYLSKYVLKSWLEHAKDSNRMLASQAVVPKPTKAEFTAVRADELRELLGAVADWCAEGRDIAALWLSPFGDTFYVAAERSRVDRSIHQRG